MTALLALGARFSDVNVLAYLAAFGGGVISFLSPCVLPLVPGYLSMVTGLDLADVARRLSACTRAASSGTTAWFVAGFGTVFVALGPVGVRIRAAAARSPEHADTPLGHVDVRDGAVPPRLAVPARAVAVSGEAVPPAARRLRRRPRRSSRASRSASAGRRASGRSSARSSASPRTSTACGPAARCSSSTRSASGCRSS